MSDMKKEIFKPAKKRTAATFAKRHNRVFVESSDSKEAMKEHIEALSKQRG